MKRTLIALAMAALPLSALAQMGSPTSPGGPPSKAPTDMAAPGASGGAKGPASASPLDTNKDGFVSREEAKKSAALSARFNELDKDHDGKLSAQELSGASARSSGGAPKTQY